jgi:hypothetical protein
MQVISPNGIEDISFETTNKVMLKVGETKMICPTSDDSSISSFGTKILEIDTDLDSSGTPDGESVSISSILAFERKLSAMVDATKLLSWCCVV